MSRALPLAAPSSKITGLVRPTIYLALALLIVTGLFDRFPQYGAIHYSLLALMMALVLFELLTLADRDEARNRPLFRLGVLILIGARIAIQATGPIDSFLYPMAYVIYAVLAAVLGSGPGVVLWVVFMGMEAGWMAVTGTGGHGWSSVAGHGFYLAAFGVAMGGLVALERRGGQKARQVLEHWKSDVNEFQRDDTVHRLSGLSEGGRRKDDLRSVQALDEAFYHALEAGRQMLGAQTLALYWRSDPGGAFRLREISSLRDDLDNAAEIAEGEGLLGAVVGERRPLRMSGARKLKGSLPHYGRRLVAAHALTAPVGGDGRSEGLLVADRDDDEFSADDEKLMAALGLQAHEIHAHALLVRRREAEAARFKSLASLSHRLSGTLELEEILDSVIRTGRAITEAHALTVILPSREGAPVIAATDGEMDARAYGREVLKKSTLAGRVMVRNERLVIDDLAEHDKKATALGRKTDPPGARSLMILPLPLGESSVGAIGFFSREPKAFSGYLARVCGVLADMAAVSIQNALLYREMEERAVTDGLTGLTNHRAFQDRLTNELDRAGRLGNKVSVLLIDIDHFKKVNDNHGHPVGDEVLKAVAATLRDSIRKVDLAARYGGEEFVLVLVGTDGRGAVDFSERIRQTVSDLVFHDGGAEFGVTLSLGVSVFPDDASGKADLIELADQALYHAKESGRNRTVAASTLDREPSS